MSSLRTSYPDTRVPEGATAPVFPRKFGDYRRVRRLFQRIIRQTGLHDVTIHDLRHTFGVHCAQSGVPLSRLQKLMGHASAVMTMRYAAHAPESYFAEDAARVATSLSGALDPEQEARASLARPALKRA